MITSYIEGDITSNLNTNDYIAHGVNCMGVMVSGVAKSIRDKWPDCFEPYKIKLEKMGIEESLGTCLFLPQEDGKIIIHCFTQKHYGNDGKRYASLKAIRSCFKFLNWSLPSLYNTNKLSIPKIGSQRGGLDWKDVERVINEETKDLEIQVFYINE